MTPAGLEDLRAEIVRLETDGREEMAERIRVARAHGDLKENSEYHDAKNDAALQETKLLRLRERLISAVVVEPADENPEIVGFGVTVHLTDEATDKPVSYTLVSSAEADAPNGKLSAESPLARALMGHRPGDLVEWQTPRGARRLRVTQLSRPTD